MLDVDTFWEMIVLAEISQQANTNNRVWCTLLCVKLQYTCREMTALEKERKRSVPSEIRYSPPAGAVGRMHGW